MRVSVSITVYYSIGEQMCQKTPPCGFAQQIQSCCSEARPRAVFQRDMCSKAARGRALEHLLRKPHAERNVGLTSSGRCVIMMTATIVMGKSAGLGA
jgi:hypothetical protein